MEVDSEKASYKQKLEVLQQQEELIEDEEEQEQKEEDARRAKREADELEAQTARSLLPDSEVLRFSSIAHFSRYNSCCRNKYKRTTLT